MATLEVNNEHSSGQQAHELSNKTLKLENEVDTHQLLKNALKEAGLGVLVCVN